MATNVENKGRVLAKLIAAIYREFKVVFPLLVIAGWRALKLDSK